MSTGTQWFAAMVANLVVTLFALTGALMMPCFRRKSDSGGTLITFAVSLAVGSLLGDATIHLIPEALGTHSHAEHTNDLGQGESEQGKDDLRNLWISCVTFIGVYSFFIVEKVLHHITASRTRRDAELSVKAQPGGIKPIVWLILVGDGLHNFVDGLAIAVAFMKSVEGGLQTSIAVLLHEIPHELGDFSVLLSSGLPLWKALLFNCLGNASAFLGSLIALTTLPDSESVKSWILAYTAGNFLYIALVDLLPSLFGGDSHSLRHDHGSCNHTSQHSEEHPNGHPILDGDSSMRSTREKASAGTTVDADVDAVSVTAAPSPCPAAFTSGEGIFREPTQDKWHTIFATHLGILTGFAAMIGISLFEAAQH